MKLEWYIARRYLASRHGSRYLSLITWISIGGVFVGVMALVLVTSVMTGLQTELRDKILATNPHLFVLENSGAMRMDDWQEPLARVRQLPQVIAAAPLVHAEVGLINAKSYGEAAMIRGIDPDAEGEPITEIIHDLREGRLHLDPERTATGFPPLLVGRALADRAGLFPGAVVQIVSLRGVRTGPLGEMHPPRRYFEVVGTFQTGMHEYDHKFLYTTLAAAQDLTGLGAAVTNLEVRTADLAEARAVGREIERLLGPAYFTQDWSTMNAALFDALKLEKLAMAIILFLIVVVAAFNIISTLVMLVADKTREIGILKSMGLKAAQVQRIFMLQGVVIGVVGAGLGVLAGIALASIQQRYGIITIPGEVYFISQLPVVVDAVDVLSILGMSILIAFLATVYPARQAARLLPVEAIRHE